MAWQEARSAYTKGDYEIVENVGEHLKRLKKEISNEAEVSLESPKADTNV